MANTNNILRVHVKCTGTRPLLVHNVRLADPLDEKAKALKAVSGKSKKTDDDHWKMGWLEFDGGLYHTEDIGPYLPTEYLWTSIIGAARQSRKGKSIERAVSMTEERMPIQYDGPRDIEGLWGGGKSQFVDRRMAGVQGKKVARTRPRFPVGWVVETIFLLNLTGINAEDFTRYVELAGETEGLGDYRRMFGRFSAEVTAH